MPHKVKILSVTPVTHDVKCFRFEKPAGYTFTPGQATDVAINQPGYTDQLRPFTFTCLQDEAFLEFTIKRYADRHGVTDRLHQLIPGDELLISDAWGAIEYKGPGYFIAGGAGLTPFIAIFRELHRQNKLTGNTLFYSNKTSGDIIYREELQRMLGKNAFFTLTREKSNDLPFGRINDQFLQKMKVDFGKHFYVCGPDPMIGEIRDILEQAGANADSIVFEK